ncbi:MAG TPA: PQQ-binding-like beta-propeller repeat protein [Roseiarcus sp.]
MMRRLIIATAAVAALGATAAGALYHFFPHQVVYYTSFTRNYIRSLLAPKGTLTTELNLAYHGAEAVRPAPARAASMTAVGDWPSYNKTLTSERFSELDAINTTNIGKFKVLCTYDTNQYTNFESGLIMVNNALIGTSEFDIFSIDPTTCAENWRTREDVSPSFYSTNRGAAYLDGMLFRGLQDGRVVAYDFNTGKRVWRTTIADPNLGETTPAAPIVWDGLVFIGNASDDAKAAKGHVYALDAKTGKIVWQFFLVPKTEGEPTRGPEGPSPLDASTWNNAPGIPISGGGTWTSLTLDPFSGDLYVPVGNPSPAFAIGVREGENLFTGSIVVLDAKTGAYRRHFQLLPRDWHDWDVNNPPALIRTSGGKLLMAAAPKDGHLYGFDQAGGAPLYRVPVTRIENTDEPFAVGKEVHFCPGAGGGAEWNSPAYDPRTNLILTGENDWCTTVSLQTDQQLRDTPTGATWFGMATRNPFHILGRQDQGAAAWAGWVYATDADTGVWKWRAKSNYPIEGGITPTAGGVVFFGDLGGNFYALDAANGQKLWGRKIGGAIAGGVITYMAGGEQKVAVATGLANIALPTDVGTGKIVVLGLDHDSASAIR